MKEEVGRRVRDARMRKNISQEKLAELAGTSLTSISRLETGKSMVSLEKLALLAEVLDVGLEELLQDFMSKNHIQDSYMERIRLLLSKCTIEEQDYWVENLQQFVDMQRRKKIREDEDA